MKNEKRVANKPKVKKILFAIPESLFELMEDSRVNQGYTRTSYLVLALKRQLYIEGYTKS